MGSAKIASLVCGFLVFAFACDIQKVSPPAPKPVHLRVNAIENSAIDGRLAVFWRQLNTEGVSPGPTLLHEAPFSATPTLDLNIPMSHIEPNEPVSIGTIAVFEDSNGNNTVDGEDKAYGVALVAVVFSPEKKKAESLGALVDIFPQGLEAGTNLYRVVSQEEKQQLFPASWEDTFDLFVCSASATVYEKCDLPILGFL